MEHTEPPVQLSPAGQPGQPGQPTQPTSNLRRWVWGTAALVGILAVTGYAAVRWLAPQNTSRPAAATGPVQPTVTGNERSRIGSGPVATLPSQLDVSVLSAQNADLLALLAKALQVSGSATIQGNLAVGGNGTFGGTLQAANFAGSGTGLTGVDAALLGGRPGSYYSGLASNLTNAASLTAPNTFTAANTFTAGLTVSGTFTASSLNLGSPLAVSSGGTGLSSVPAAGVLYGQGGPTLGVATPAAAGLCLLSAAADVQWGSCAAGSLGGSGTAGQLAKFTAAGTIGDSSISDTGTQVSVAPGAVFSPQGGILFPADNFLQTSSFNSTNPITGILIPLYIYPANVYTNADYNGLIALAKKYHSVPTTVILDPANGPGASADGNYTAAIKRLHGAGVKVLGYVFSNYTAQSQATVETDIDTWQSLYPGIDGLFIDEMTNDANAGHVTYYQQLTQYAHGKGLYPVVTNPGTDVVQSYYDNHAADIINTVEANAYPAEATLQGDFAGGNADYYYARRSGAIYNQGSFDYSNLSMARKYLGNLYVTNDNLPNPWDTLPPYLDSEYRALDNAGSEILDNLTVETSLQSPNLDTVTNANLAIGNVNATGVDIGNTGLDNLTTIYGSGLVKSSAGLNSTTAFQIQNAVGSSLFTADTTNSVISTPGNLIVNNTTGCSYSSYISYMNGLSPASYWKLEDAGSSAADSSGNNNTGTLSNVTVNQTPGAFSCASGHPVMSFNSGTNSQITTPNSFNNPTVYSEITMFKTSGSGTLLSFSDASTSWDRELYVGSDGKLYAGIFDGAQEMAISPGSVADGNWHLAVATESGGGLFLYLDGRLVASNAGAATPQPYTGTWWVGRSWGGGWQNMSQQSFGGEIAQAAVTTTALTAPQVQALATYGGFYNGELASIGVGTATPMANIDDNGTALFHDPNNSTTAFQIQNASGAGLFTADTANNAIVLGQDNTPTALTVRGGAATGTNASGGNITFDASNGTGAGGSGAFIFRTAKPGGNSIGVDNTGHVSGGGANPITLSFTTGNQPNRLLVVTDITAPGDSYTSVTYNGVNLTQLATVEAASGPHVEMWYLVNPPSGTHNIAATLSNACCGRLIGATTFYNVDQTTPFGTVATGSGTGTTNSGINVTTTSAAQLVVDGLGSNGGDPVNYLGGQTELWNQPPNGGDWPAAGASQPGNGGIVNMSWDVGGAIWADIGVPINPTSNSTTDALTDVLHIANSGNIGIDNSNPTHTLDVSGTASFQNAADSTNAFQIQNAAGTSNLLVADTTNNRIGIGTATPSQLLEVSGGNAQVTNGNLNVNYGGINVTGIAPPSSHITATPTGSGILNGDYYYYVSYLTQSGESLSDAGGGVPVVSPVNQQVALTNIPTGPAGVIGRKIYRSPVNPPFPYTGYLLTTINDNTTTTYTDNAPDGSLGGPIPTYNTTSYVSNPQGLAHGEAFGLLATLEACSNETAIGYAAVAGWCDATALGSAATAWGAGSTAIGSQADAAGYLGTAVGAQSTAGQKAVALGKDATANDQSIAIGRGATTTNNHQLVIGSSQDGAYIQDAYIGDGVTDPSPQSVTLHATGGSGANVAGADFNLAGGAGTGNANGGNINFMVALPGTSGSSANVPTTVASLSGANGAASFKNFTNSTSGFVIQSAGGNPILTADTTNQRLTVGTLTTGATAQLYVGGLLPQAYIGSWGTGNNASGRMAVNNGYAYIAEYGSSKMWVLDVSNPASPVQLSYTSIGIAIPTDVVVQGRYAYVSGRGTGGTDDFAVVDISNPRAPTLVHRLDIAGSTAAARLIVQGRYAYLEMQDATDDYIKVIDISNASNAKVVGSLQIDSGLVGVWDMKLSGHYLYIPFYATSGTGLNIVDISSPFTPTSVATLPIGTAGSGLYQPQTISIKGRYAYIGMNNGTDGSLASNGEIVDISDPTNPAELGTYSFGTAVHDQNPQQSLVEGNRLYTDKSRDSLIAVDDISDPANPVFLGNIPAPGNDQSFFIDSRNLYALGYNPVNPNLRIYDLGGTYTQQLQAGNIATGDFSATGDASITGNLSLQGGIATNSLNVQQNAGFGADIAVTGSQTLYGTFFQLTSANSITAMQVQNASGSSIFDVDTTNGRVGIGTNTPTARLTVDAVDALSSNTALTVNDSNGGNLAQIRDDGLVDLGVASTPIIGNNNSTGTVDNGINTVISADKFTTRNTATTVTSLSVYVSAIDSSPHDQYQLAIYADNGSGKPGALVASSGVGTLTGNSWNTLAISASLAPNTTYWFAYGTNPTVANKNDPVYQATTQPDHAYTTYSWTTVSGFPDPFGGSTTNNSIHAIYATTTGVNIPAFTIGTNGNVGIGTGDAGNPGANLEIHTNTNTANAFQIQDSSNAQALNVDTTNLKVSIASTLDTISNTGLNIGNANATGVSIGNTGANNLNTLYGSTLVKSATGLNSTTAFQVQNSAGTSLLTADTATTLNTLGDTASSFESGNVWAQKGSPTSVGQDNAQSYSGNGSLKIVTGATANAGAQDTVNFTNGNWYVLSLYARITSGTFTTLSIGHTEGGADIDCLTGQTVVGATSLTGWTRYQCTFQAGATVAGTIYVKDTGTAHTFWIDGVQMEAGASGSSTASAYNPGGQLQVIGLISGPIAVKNKENSTTAFHVESAIGSQVFNIDTDNNRVVVGSGSSNSKFYVTTATSGQSTMRLNESGSANLIEGADNGTNSVVIAQEGSYASGMNSGLTGSGTATNGSTGAGVTVTGSSSNFREVFKPGDTLTYTSGTAESCTVTAVTDETHLTCSSLTATHTTATYTYSGAGDTDRINLNANGQLSLGANLTTGTLNDQLTIDNTSTSGVTTNNYNGAHVNYKGGSAAVEGSGIRVDFTPGGTSGGTWNGLRIATSTKPASGVNAYGISLVGPGTGASGTEAAINIDTGWDIGIAIANGGIQMSGQTDPSAPATAATQAQASGSMKVYAQSIDGRMFLMTLGPSGTSTAAQPALFQKEVAWITPRSTGNDSAMGTDVSQFGTRMSGIAASQSYGWMGEYQTSGAATSNAGISTNNTTGAWFYRGSAAGANGFFFHSRVYFPDASYANTGAGTGSRAFVGLSDQGITTNVSADNAAGNRIGFSFVNVNGGRTDTDWQISSKDGTTENLTDTTLAFTPGKVYDCYLYTPPQGTTIYWRLDNLTDSTTASGSTATNLPTASSAMSGGDALQSVDAVVRNIALQSIYIESDR